MPPSPQTDVEFQRGIADTHNKKVFSILHDRFRVLSLVGSLFDLDAKEGESDEQVTLMWSHYADQFQGICLALDPLRFRNGIQLGGFAVKYPPERQRLPASYYDCYLALDAERSGVPGYPKDPESELLLPQAVLAERDRERFIELLTHKSPAWAYEREIRMIYEIAQQRKLPDYRRIEFPCETCKQRGFPAEKCEKPWYRDAIEVPPEAILAVIFATDCMMTTVQKLFSILDDPRYRHVEFYWSCLHSSRYAVQYVKGERSYIEFMQEERTKQVAQAKKHQWWDDKGVPHMRPAPKGVTYDVSKLPKPEQHGS